MKKLMIALSVVAMAVASQAAVIKWGAGTVKLPGEDGKQTGATVATTDHVTMYVWETASLVDASTIYGTYITDGVIANTPIKGSTWSRGAQTLTGSTYAKNATAYAAVLVHYDVNNNGKMDEGDFYIANSASYLNEADTDKTIGSLATNAGGAGGAALSWQAAQAVPEPTSGLLLLLGVAGLALRRRRA